LAVYDVHHGSDTPSRRHYRSTAGPREQQRCGARRASHYRRATRTEEAQCRHPAPTDECRSPTDCGEQQRCGARRASHYRRATRSRDIGRGVDADSASASDDRSTTRAIYVPGWRPVLLFPVLVLPKASHVLPPQVFRGSHAIAMATLEVVSPHSHQVAGRTAHKRVRR
jgi:hypothetical protein